MTVTGAASDSEARTIARNVADSPLVKTAVHGADPNWGRVIVAAGKDPECRIDPEQLELRLQDQLVFAGGMPTTHERAQLAPLLQRPEVKVQLNLNIGAGSATAWGCDLGRGYIDINVEYS